MEVTNKHIDLLIPYAKNARVHDDAQIAQIAGSKAYILADNRIAINSTWDNEMLSLELMDIKDDVSLAMLGFNVDELDNILSNKNFDAGTIDDQGKLDEIKPKYVACPDCGHEFNANDKTTHTH